MHCNVNIESDFVSGILLTLKNYMNEKKQQ